MDPEDQSIRLRLPRTLSEDTACPWAAVIAERKQGMACNDSARFSRYELSYKRVPVKGNRL